jgi:hypothetical protein
MTPFRNYSQFRSKGPARHYGRDRSVCGVLQLSNWSLIGYLQLAKEGLLPPDEIEDSSLFPYAGSS